MLIYKRVERLAESSDLVLDLGAKNGSNVTESAATVVAIDIKFAEFSRKSDTEYLYADGRMLPFDDDVFDYVVVNQVLEHVDDKKSLCKEVARVLDDGGTALFSFPNRFSFNKPHGLPRVMSFIPKPIGLPLAKSFFDENKYRYYRESLYPLSPIGSRLALREEFEKVDYVTLEESVENPAIYSNQPLPQVFVALLPLLSFITQFSPIQTLFEILWSHVAYECRI